MKRLLILIIFLVYHSLFGQERQTLHRNEQWIEYYAQLKLNAKYKVIFDGGCRWRDNFDTGVIYFARTGLDYALTDKINVHLGFAHVGYFSGSESLGQIEHRPYQELSMQNTMKSINILHRIRVEERFFEPISNEYSNSFNWFNWRFRYMIMFDIPLFRLSKTKPDYRVSLGLGDEIFINAGRKIVYNHFDQNRLLCSPTFHFGKNFNIGVTWSNQYAATTVPNQYLHSQVIWLQVRQKFNFD